MNKRMMKNLFRRLARLERKSDMIFAKLMIIYSRRDDDIFDRVVNLSRKLKSQCEEEAEKIRKGSGR